MKESSNVKHNELLEYARNQHSWSREYVAARVGAPETRMVYTWEREGVLPHPRYRQALSTLFNRSLRELGLVKKGEIPFWNVPYPQNPYFTGREDILRRLHNALVKDRSEALKLPHALSGLGGIGKTHIAIEYAYRYGHEYQSVLWARADTREVLMSNFAAIAELLRLSTSDARDQQHAVKAFKDWLSSLTRWLLILDNVEDLNIVRDFLPLQGKGQTLLTTRLQFTGTIAQDIAIEPMELQEAAYFLLRRAKIIEQHVSPGRVLASDNAHAHKLSQLMGGLPLALDQAAAYIEETGCSVGAYLALYQHLGTTLLNERGMIESDHPEAVVSTLLLSFKKVQQVNPLAAELLQFCAFLHPDAIPEEIMSIGVSELDCGLSAFNDNRAILYDCMRELRKLSLLRQNGNTGMRSIHRLVQAVLKSELDEETKRLWAKRVVLAVNKVFPEVQVITWQACERLLPQARTCLHLITHYQFEFAGAARLLDLAGLYLYERGRYAQSAPFLQHALQIREKVSGPQHPDTALCLNHLGLLYHAQGKFEESKASYQRALDIREKAQGLEHPETASILYNLGLLYHAQGKFEQAEALYQRSFKIREERLGPQHADTAASLNDLAVLYADQGKFEQAEQLGQRVLEIREKVLHADHPDIAITLSNLAGFYHIQGKYNLAEPLFTRACKIFEKNLGLLHPYTATSFDNLAALYLDQGKYRQAEALSRQALKIKERVLGPGHPDVSQSLTTLASLYQAQGIYEQAELLYRRALAIYETALGPSHAYTAGGLTNLATLYTLQGKNEQAEPLARRALAIKEQILGPQHVKTATSLNNLAAICLASGKYEEAEMLCKRALVIQEQVLEAGHLQIADSLVTLSHIYIAEDRYQEAEPLLHRALAIRQQAWEAEHPEVISILENYADLLHKMGRIGEAERLEEQLRTIHIKQMRKIPASPTGGEEKETNPLAEFISTRCELHSNASSGSSDLWRAYQRWVQETGEYYPVRTQKSFGQYLKSMGCRPYRTNKRRMWRGIALQDRLEENL